MIKKSTKIDKALNYLYKAQEILENVEGASEESEVVVDLRQLIGHVEDELYYAHMDEMQFDKEGNII